MRQVVKCADINAQIGVSGKLLLQRDLLRVSGAVQDHKVHAALLLVPPPQATVLPIHSIAMVAPVALTAQAVVAQSPTGLFGRMGLWQSMTIQ